MSAAIPGGATNPDSVCAGLAVVPADAAVIALYSPSHPLASPTLAHRVIEHLATGVDGACPVAPIHDALRRLDEDGGIVESVSNQHIVSVQMPLAFRADVLRDALALDNSDSDAQTIVERYGAHIGMIVGEPTNIHVTTHAELEMARNLAPIVDHGN